MFAFFDFWSCFCHTYDCGIRSETYLFLEEVLELLVTDCLVGSCINSPYESHEFTLLEIEAVLSKETIKVYGVESAFICSVNGFENAQSRKVRSSFEIIC